MEFDKSRCYSALNADELKQGDKVIVANSLSYLKHRVECDECMDEIVSILSDDNQNRFLISGSRTFALAYLVERADKAPAWFVKGLMDGSIERTSDEAEMPELISLGNGQYVEKHTDYNHCEEARKAYACAMTNACPNKHYRPFKDVDELIEEWDKKLGYRDPTGLAKPYIWVQRKGMNTQELITGFDKECIEQVKIDGVWRDMQDLFTLYTFLDSSFCGVEE